MKVVGVGSRSLKPVVVPGSKVRVRVVSGGSGKKKNDGGGDENSEGEEEGALALNRGFSLPYNSQLELNENFTIAFWYRPQTEEEGGGTGEHCLIDRSVTMEFDGSMTLKQIRLGVLWESGAAAASSGGDGGEEEGEGRERWGTLSLGMGNAEMGTGVELSKEKAIKAGEWQHLAVTVSGSDVVLLVNGGVAARGDFSGARLGAPNNCPVSFGVDSSGGSQAKGWVHDLRLASVGRSELEVRNGMQEKLPAAGGNEVTSKYQVAIRFRSVAEAKINLGSLGDQLRPRFGSLASFMDSFVEAAEVTIDTDVPKLPGASSREVWGWKVQLRPIWDLDSIPNSDVEKLRREYCVGGLKHDEALVKYANEVCLKKNLDTSMILR